MDVRDLQVFLSVAKHLNFTRAAEEVHLSQPSVSVRIRQSLKHIPPPNEKGPVHRGLGLQFYFTGLENVSSGSRLFPSFWSTEDLDFVVTASSNRHYFNRSAAPILLAGPRHFALRTNACWTPPIMQVPTMSPLVLMPKARVSVALGTSIDVNSP